MYAEHANTLINDFGLNLLGSYICAAGVRNQDIASKLELGTLPQS